MRIIGVNGGFDLSHERRMVLGEDATHDAAACLLENGQLVAAIEEERLTRIKHCAKFPTRAIEFCLNKVNLTVDQIDRFAVFTDERFADYYLSLIALNRAHISTPPTYREFFAGKLGANLGERIDPARIEFVPHHIAHAWSAYIGCPYRESLILVIDGQGETFSGLVATAGPEGINVLRTFSVEQSLGYMYMSTIRMLGYWFGDEYKAMGLAPHGEPSRFRRVFDLCYRLLPGGNYEVNEAAICASLLRFCRPRRSGEEFTQTHMDIAAALQQAVERIVLHVLTHYRETTGLEALAMAGGVAHNSSLNGKIIQSGLFKHVFVHPAAYDPGCGLGAAMATHARFSSIPLERGTPTPFLGSDAQDGLEQRLEAWGELISWQRSDDVAAQAAEQLAAGDIIGWTQGRSEFGPRALGSRNILADPRPHSNQDRVNKAIKQRESYRPFAPAVKAESTEDFFALPNCDADYRFMGFVVPVREDRKATLGAVAHVDGSARIQTVARADAPLFWRLLDHFGALTGTPILLSTSFNNHAEPIVETADDSIVCLLTTGLNRLFIGDFVVSAQLSQVEAVKRLRLSLPPHVRLECIRQTIGNGHEPGVSARMTSTSKERFEHEISVEAYELLSQSDGRTTVDELLRKLTLGADERARALSELCGLWSNRLICLKPD